MLRNIGKKKTTALLLNGVSVELKAHFKAYCAKRQTSMKAMIVSMMKDRLEDNERLLK